MIERIQRVLDEYGVEEVWSTLDHFQETELADFYLVGKDKKKVNRAADRILSIVAPKIDSEDPEENESVIVCMCALEDSAQIPDIVRFHKLVEGGKIIG